MAGNLGEIARGIDQALATRVGRRTVITRGALGGLATFLAACGGKIGPITLPGGSAEPAATATPEPLPNAASQPTAAATTEAPKPTATTTATAPATAAPTAAPTPAATVAARAEGRDTVLGPGSKVPDRKDMAPLPEAFRLPKENGKYRTFDRAKVVVAGIEIPVLLSPDIGSLGPDTDTLFGVDLPGDIDTEGIEVFFHPGEGKVLETRVIGRRRDDLKYLQFRDILGGDAFDEIEVMKFGGNEGARVRDRRHAALSGHTHQKVVYIGDVGAFENQYGENPRIRTFLHRLFRAQVPPRVGIPESNFVIKKT